MPRNDEVVAKSERELGVLCDEYRAWLDGQGLDLGSADEHLFDESLTDEQRAWLQAFSQRWEDASLVWTRDGARQGRD